MKRVLTILLLALLPGIFNSAAAGTSRAAPANASGVVSVCDEAHLLAALSGGGMVTFTCSGTITLSGTIGISTDTTINGSGQDVTISGANAYHVLNVEGGVTLELVDLTIANGYGGVFTSGGGINISGFGTLNATRVTFTGNYSAVGGAISNHGELNLTDSILSYNNASGTNYVFAGGAIYNGYGGNATISGSTFIGNSSNTGGAIYSLDGLVTVSNSTFSGNSADPNTGGAIRIVSGAALDVFNSTFSGNSANAFGGGAAIDNEDGIVTLTNTITANPSDGQNCAGAIADGGGNLSYPDATCPGLNADPLLGPLQNNGGPTLTFDLTPGSAAIDLGDDAVCAAEPVNGVDQRGYARPVGVHCDAGAVESSAAPPPPQYRIFLPLTHHDDS